jgi:hypothetical protein
MTINREFEPDIAAYLDAHGCRRRGNRLLIPSRCQHLKGDSLPYTCDIHGTMYQPLYCQLYPGQNETPILPFNGCGYRKGMPSVPPDGPVLRLNRALKR